MSYSFVKETKNLLKQYNLFPKKGLGQNFLIDATALKKIISAADLEPNDVVLEIGPGTGILTLELAKYAKRVVAVEKDEKMASALRDTLQKLNIQNVEIVTGDALKIPYADYNLPDDKYKIIANLPYYITAPFIRKFLESKLKPELIVLMIQKEVAQRICAKPPKMSLLAVAVQIYAKPEIVSFVSKKSFWPHPKVDSAILKITEIKPIENTVSINTADFFRVVKAGFSQPRKQILNNLSRLRLANSRGQAKGLALSGSNGLKLSRDAVIAWLAKNKIKPEQRAETLNMADWIGLAKSLPS